MTSDQAPVKTPAEGRDTPPDRAYFWARKITFAIALTIVLTLVGLVLYSWVTQVQQPPVLSVTWGEEVRQVQDQFYVPFEVENTGGGTAESVQIVAELRVQGQVAETGEQQVDFLSSGERARGAFVFSHAPQPGELSIRAASYKLP